MKWIGRILYLFLMFMIATFVIQYSQNIKYTKFYEEHAVKLLTEDYNKEEYLSNYFVAANARDYLNTPLYESASLDSEYPFDFSIYSARSIAKGQESIQTLVFYYDDRNINNFDSYTNFEELGHITNKENLDKNPNLVFIKINVTFEGDDKPLEQAFFITRQHRTPVPVLLIADGEYVYNTVDDKGKSIQKRSKLITNIELIIEDYSEDNGQDREKVKIKKLASIKHDENANMDSLDILTDLDNSKVFTSSNFNGSVVNFNHLEDYKDSNLVTIPNRTLLDQYKNTMYPPIITFLLIAFVFTYLIFFLKPTIQAIRSKRRGELAINEEYKEPANPYDTLKASNSKVEIEVVEDNTTNIEEELVEEKDIITKEDLIDLNTLTVVQLKEKAKELGLTGYSTLKKNELIELIQSNQK